MESPKSQPQNLDEYSAATTVINFDRPIPLLRGPIRRPSPSSGPYVLAFRDLQTWFSALKSSESQILDQCVTGARIGCALTASNKCKPPWWRSLIGPKQTDLKAREQCEAREMEACFVTAKEKCVAFAAEKCATPFRDAWIATRVNPKVARRLIGWASVPERCTWINLIGLDLGDREFGETNCYKASELLGSNTDFGSDRFKVTHASSGT
ncbi:hypothetical protein ACB092_10G206900 [Castanea dentata]